MGLCRDKIMGSGNIFRIAKAILFILVIISLPFISQPAEANSGYHAIGYEYQSPYNLLKVEGHISTARVISDGCGRAGIEQDITIVTDTSDLMLEVINWYRNGKVVVGITVYQNGDYYFSQKVDAIEGEIYSYEVYIYNGNVYVSISVYGSGELVYHKILEGVGAKYIPRTASYIEYYRDCDCPFYYYGWVSINYTKYLISADDFYYKAKETRFDMYLVHKNWGDFFDKGEIDDRK